MRKNSSIFAKIQHILIVLILLYTLNIIKLFKISLFLNMNKNTQKPDLEEIALRNLAYKISASLNQNSENECPDLINRPSYFNTTNQFYLSGIFLISENF